MPKQSRELSALEVGRLRRDGFNPVGAVPGLGLQITGVARSWILRFSFDGRRPEMGLGGFPEVSLADARNAAREARAKVRAGVNPIEALKPEKRAAAAKLAASKTFSFCAAAFIKAKSPEWANSKHAAQWTSTLRTYAEPVIGALPVQDVSTAHVLEILEPIWLTKTETATRLRSRIENVLDWAIVAKHRDGPNPARWKGHMAVLLAKPTKVAKVEHHAALPHAQLPAFMEHLRAAEGQGARALEFAILTAARSGEVRGATWSEIDFDAGAWNVPAERMKSQKPHRVPLSRHALGLIRGAGATADPAALIFPGAGGGQLSDMTLSSVLRRMDLDAVPHGFRATFKTWASECTAFPRDVVEVALAHVIEGKVEGAYMRGDLFIKRAKLMQAWSEFCTRAPSATVVTSIRKASPARQGSAGSQAHETI
jgi:integrase